MTTTQDRIAAIIAAYGGPNAPGMPTRDAWARVAACAAEAPISLVNFFKFRDRANYADGTEISGQQAFERYASISGACLSKAGGRFLLVAPFGGSLIGPEEDWDLVAIGTYPDPDALLRLFELEDYHTCFAHRTAACADQRVALCSG